MSLIGISVLLTTRRLVPAIDGVSALVTAPELRSAIQAQVDQVNETLARVEQVKRFAILPRPFGIDSGELTPTMKIKREVVAQIYKREIDALYADAE